MGQRAWILFTITICVLFITGSINFANAQVLSVNPSLKIVLGEGLTITVTNPDPNIRTVTVVNLDGTDSETITLDDVPSTSAAGGTNSIAGMITVSINDDQGVLQADDGDRIEVRYDTLVHQTIAVPDNTIAYPTGTRQPISDLLSCANNGNDGSGIFPFHDNICDDWEDSITDKVTISGFGDSYTYDCLNDAETWIPKECGPDKPDVFLEIDWMEGHEPSRAAIEQVVQVFDDHGVRLHIQVDQEPAIGHDPDIPWPGYEYACCPHWKGFDQIKGDKFGTKTEKQTMGTTWDKDDPVRKLKHQIFHYCLFVHERAWYLGQSGVGEIDGNDCMVSLGWTTGKVGSIDQQAGTLMHELGHNFRLGHGGHWKDNNSTKPNYFSVMSYSRQFADYDPDRRLDFSDMVLGHPFWTVGYLNETKLKEGYVGLEEYIDHPDDRIIYSCPDGQAAPLTYKTGTPVDWNCDGTWDPNGFFQENIDNLPVAPNTIFEENLLGHDDWESLDFKFTDNSDFEDGRHENGGNGIAGGITPPAVAVAMISGLPPGVTEDASGNLQGLPPGLTLTRSQLGNDPGFNYVSNEIEENTLSMITEVRISRLLTLFRALEFIPEGLFDSGPNNSPFSSLTGTAVLALAPNIIAVEHLPEDSQISNFNPVFAEFLSPGTIGPFGGTISITTEKQKFTYISLLAMDEINHHDIDETQQLIRFMDDSLSKSLNPKAYDSVKPILTNLDKSYTIALTFNKTSIHNTDHQPLMDPIIDPGEITLMIQEVDSFVDGVNLPDADGDGIPDRFDECENESGDVENDGCPNGPPWWILLILVAIAIGIAVARRIRNRP